MIYSLSHFFFPLAVAILVPCMVDFLQPDRPFFTTLELQNPSYDVSKLLKIAHLLILRL